MKEKGKVQKYVGCDSSEVTRDSYFANYWIMIDRVTGS